METSKGSMIFRHMWVLELKTDLWHVALPSSSSSCWLYLRLACVSKEDPRTHIFSVEGQVINSSGFVGHQSLVQQFTSVIWKLPWTICK